MERTHDAVIIEPTAEHTHSVVWLHGLGADGHDFVPIVAELQLSKSANTRFIFPHAQIMPVSLHNGIPLRAWYDISGIAPLQYDEAGAKKSRQRIANILDTEQANGIDSRHIVLAGFSQGGSLALITALTYPQPLAGIIALSTFVPEQVLTQSHTLYNQQTPIFIAHGNHDSMVPYRLGKHCYELLSNHHYTVEWHEYAMDHSVCLDEIRDLKTFFSQRGM